MMDSILDNFHLILLTIAVLSIAFIVISKKSKPELKKDIKKIKDVDSLNEFLKPYGYAYDPHQDIFYSIVDAWQREMGYTRLYDEAAAPASMIMDCEPIYFEYNNRRWMIEFWKGQYGMTTGLEIGVYYTDKLDLKNEYINWTLYDCADDNNMLKMKFHLPKMVKL